MSINQEISEKISSKFHDSRPKLQNPSELSILSCLHFFTDPEILEGEEAFACIECTKRDLVKNFLGIFSFFCVFMNFLLD